MELMEEKKSNVPTCVSIFLTEINLGCTIIKILIFKLFNTFLIVSNVTEYADILYSWQHCYIWRIGLALSISWYEE